MKLAYLSGKYTDPRGPAFESINIADARLIAIQLWSLGIAVISPHANSAHMDGATDYETVMEGDFLMVEVSDLVIMVPNWLTSGGAKRERERAHEKGIAVFYWPADLHKILEFCWPDGIPAQHVKQSKQTLPEDLYAVVKGYRCVHERLALQTV